MQIDVLITPAEVKPGALRDRAVVVLDVLRATTTMAAALAAGVKAIHVYGELEAAVRAARAFGGSALLCGERNCLPPEGFHLGNSPGAYTPEQHAARTVFMSTTNGTRALVAAQLAGELMIGALVNCSAVAARLNHVQRNITLLCAGTNGAAAMEDIIGAGAIIAALQSMTKLQLSSDTARMALRLFESLKADLQGALSDATGGRNVIAAGLADDVAFAARLDALKMVGVVHPSVRDGLVVTALKH